jgi:hypothetical protein
VQERIHRLVSTQYIRLPKSFRIRILAVQTSHRVDPACLQRLSIERFFEFPQIRSPRATRGGGIDELGDRKLPGFGVLASSLGAAETRSKITVFVYNYAAVSSEVLALTEAEASRIYQQAGIEIEWLDCPLATKDASQFPACQVPPGPTKLALRILSQPMTERLRQAEDSFGFAMIPDDGTFAVVANVFSYDAEQLANRRGMRHGVILGHLVAHELGHLLLGAGSHSSHGIMHVPWRLKELETIAQGLMVSRPEEAEEMQTNIRRRVAREKGDGGRFAPRNFK